MTVRSSVKVSFSWQISINTCPSSAEFRWCFCAVLSFGWCPRKVVIHCCSVLHSSFLNFFWALNIYTYIWPHIADWSDASLPQLKWVLLISSFLYKQRGFKKGQYTNYVLMRNTDSPIYVNEEIQRDFESSSQDEKVFQKILLHQRSQ